MRACSLGLALAVVAAHLATADPLIREPLVIPMAAAGPRGLEALLVRPGQPGRHPLALINHGSPRNPSARADMTPMGMLAQATEFARRGWATLVTMRRGFGASGGGFADGFGACRDPDYPAAATRRSAAWNIDPFCWSGSFRSCWLPDVGATGRWCAPGLHRGQ